MHIETAMALAAAEALEEFIDAPGGISVHRDHMRVRLLAIWGAILWGRDPWGTLTPQQVEHAMRIMNAHEFKTNDIATARGIEVET